MITNKDEAKRILLQLKQEGFLDKPVNGAKMKWLRKNYPILIEVAEKYMVEYKLRCLTESFYWLINDIETYPECKFKLDSKCTNRPAFINFFKGYYDGCGVCSRHKPGSTEKIRQTCLARYGVTNPMRNKEILDKRSTNNIEKYGVAYPIQRQEIANKMKQTMVEKYGSENASYVPELKEKSKQTLINTYNDPDKKKEILEKGKKTYLEHYGVEHYTKTDKFKQDIIDAWNNSGRYEKVKNKLLKLCELYDIQLLEELICGKSDYKYKCIKCGYEGILNTIQFVCGKYYWCPECHPHSGSSSKGEHDISTYIQSNFNGLECLHNKREIIDGRELDLYFPSKNIAIEYCGLIWHATKPTGISGGGYDEDYHINKYLKCKNKNILLLTVYEDEWVRLENRENIKNRLLTYFGKGIEVDAQWCDVDKIDVSDFNNFLTDNTYFNQIKFTEYYSIIFNERLIGVIGKIDNNIQIFQKNNIILKNIQDIKNKIDCNFIIYNNRWPLISDLKSELYEKQMAWKFGNNIQLLDESYTYQGIIHDCGYSKLIL